MEMGICYDGPTILLDLHVGFDGAKGGLPGCVSIVSCFILQSHGLSTACASIRSSLSKQYPVHHRVQIESLSILSSPVILPPSHPQSRTRMSGVLLGPGNPPSCSVPAVGLPFRETIGVRRAPLPSRWAENVRHGSPNTSIPVGNELKSMRMLKGEDPESRIP